MAPDMSGEIEIGSAIQAWAPDPKQGEIPEGWVVVRIDVIHDPSFYRVRRYGSALYYQIEMRSLYPSPAGDAGFIFECASPEELARIFQFLRDVTPLMAGNFRFNLERPR